MHLPTLILAGFVGLSTLAGAAAPAPAAPLVRSATGPDISSIIGARDAFRVDLGGGTVAGANGSFGGLRREINWDGVPDNFAEPNNLPANFFNVNSPRGAIFTTPGSGFQVSADSANPTGTPIDFGAIDASYPATFEAFSAQRLFTALGSTIIDVLFFVPGTTQAALTSGFGAVFSDVDRLGSTTLEFFDANSASLGAFAVPATPGSATFSFLGASFGAPVVSRVRIVSGDVALGSGVTDALGRDLVAMDDFLYGEPTLAAVTVPEPESLPLLGAALLGLALTHRSRRARV